ncbi:alpha/beta fold hydrolase [Algoriphagus formosus]|uniref:alpha/beta fold hydrolase n=1 Tax=Algoriphagus formosus TaxID=2007308 RepID=UPI000C28EF4A|nr:alpha/beta hydrolase [Algoriphagus formosus]
MKNSIFKISTIILFLFIASCDLSEKTLDSVSSSYITLNDSKVHYKEYGQGAKSLIFIHGWGCDLNTWKYQFDYFKDKYHLVLIDLPGYGQSDKVEQDYTIDLFAQSVSELVRDLEIKNPVLVAHSMGLPIAIEVLKQLNTETAILVNIDGVYFDFPTDSIESNQYEEGLTEFANMFNVEDYKQNVEQFCNGFITESTPEDVRSYIISTMTETPQTVGYQSMKSLIDQKYWDKKILKNQTISIYAKTDELVPDNENLLRKQFPNLTYIEMDSVNHFLMMEKPKKVNEILKGFIEK